MKFIKSLSVEAQDKDFRVIAHHGGYGPAIQDLEYALAESQAPSAILVVTAQRDKVRLFLRITVNSNSFSRDGDLFRFDGSVGEFLDFDGHETANFVLVTLSIDPTPTQEGQTVGVLRMQDYLQLSPTTLGEGFDQ